MGASGLADANFHLWMHNGHIIVGKYSVQRAYWVYGVLIKYTLIKPKVSD